MTNPGRRFAVRDAKLQENLFMEQRHPKLGHIPHVDMQELKKNVSELEERLSALQSEDEANDHTTLSAVTALLRNRRNLMEMLQRDRFI